MRKTSFLFTLTVLIMALMMTLPASVVAQGNNNVKLVFDNNKAQRNLSPSKQGKLIADINRIIRNNQSKANSATDDSQTLITNPEGTVKKYHQKMAVHLDGMGNFLLSGIVADLIESTDGKSVYFMKLLLGYQTGHARGDYDQDGNIVVKSGQYVFDLTEDDVTLRCFLMCATSDADGTPIVKESNTLTVNADGTITSADGDFFMLYKEEYLDESYTGEKILYCYSLNLKLTPMPEMLEEAKVPADAILKEFTFKRNDVENYGDEVTTKEMVAFSGNNVYLPNFSSRYPDLCLMGVRQGNTITCKSHQYIGRMAEDGYYMELSFLRDFWLGDDNFSGLPSEEITFTISDEEDLIEIETDGAVMCNFYGDQSNWESLAYGIRYIHFDNSPAVPAAPSNVQYYQSQHYAYFDMSTRSEDGKLLNEEGLYYQLIVNGEPYTFKPEYYTALTQDMTLVPYNFTDHQDIFGYGSTVTLYLREFEQAGNTLKSIGVCTAYVQGGQTNYSDTIYAPGFEPMNDVAATPATPSNVMLICDSFSKNIEFDLPATDADGNALEKRLLAYQLWVNDKQVVFSADKYYTAYDITDISYDDSGANSLYVSLNTDGHIELDIDNEDLGDILKCAVRAVYYGGGETNYSDFCTIEFGHPAIPAEPTNVSLDKESGYLTFDALPIDINGNALNPACYGFEVFANGELHTFKAADYEMSNDISLLPMVPSEEQTFLTNYDKSYTVQCSESDLQDMGNVNVRAVYTAGGETNYSNMTNGIASSTLAKSVKKVEYTNMQGCRITSPTKGSLVIKTITYSDGIQRSRKMVVR